MNIAGFPAFNYFGDGSFYLIDSPGVRRTAISKIYHLMIRQHDIGHISALARTTTSPHTFIFIGGDISNHAGEFRPSEHIPLPALISPNPLNNFSPVPCPGHIFEKIHPKGHGHSPFYGIGTWPDGDSCALDLPAALESHRKLRLLDAQDAQVFVILAHDENIGDVIDFFPKNANAWKKLGWADKARWMFLGDYKEAVSEHLVHDEKV